jgi:hypothetical protein
VRHIGLDVHRDFCEVAIAAAGKVRSPGRIDTKPEVLELFARSLDCEDQVALEVTGNAWEVARIIEPHVARVIVVSPTDTGIRQARAKTDRLDARKLACLFWCLLTREEDYAFAQPSLTKKKFRRLELTAGAERGKVKPGAWSTNKALGKAERELAQQAEVAYRRLVADWQSQRKRKGAGVPVGRD